MRKAISLLILIFISNIIFCQTKLCYDVYYFKNPEHKFKTYKNILVFSNASYKTQAVFHKAANYANFNITLSSELFPPIKIYTDEEIEKAIRDENIDAIIYFTITSSVEVKDRNIYGTYTMPTLGGFGTFVTRQHSHEYTTIEAVLVEPASKDKKEFYCSGGAKGSSYDVGYRVFNKMLEHFEEIGIASPPSKK